MVCPSLLQHKTLMKLSTLSYSSHWSSWKTLPAAVAKIAPRPIAPNHRSCCNTKTPMWRDRGRKSMKITDKHWKIAVAACRWLPQGPVCTAGCPPEWRAESEWLKRIQLKCHSSTCQRNPSSCKNGTYLFYIVNIMVADVLVMQGARASTTMILT